MGLCVCRRPRVRWHWTGVSMSLYVLVKMEGDNGEMLVSLEEEFCECECVHHRGQQRGSVCTHL